MNIKKVIDIVNETRKPGYSEERVKEFIEECDKRIYRNIAELYENELEPYEERYPLETEDELIADDAFSMLYVWYALCQIDIFNGETDRYINDLIQFNDYYEEFEKYYGRKHSLKSRVLRIITD